MSPSATLAAKPAPEPAVAKKERLLTRGMGVLLALAIYLPLQEKIEFRLERWTPGWPIVPTVTNFLLAAGIVCLILVPKAKGRPDSRTRWLTRAFVGMGLFFTLGFLTAQLHTEGFYFWEQFADWRRWASVMLLYFFAKNFLRTPKQVTLLLYAMTLVLAFADYNLLRENFSSGLSSSHFDEKLRYAGLFMGGGVNDLGAFFAEFIFIPLALLSLEKRQIRKLFLLGVIFLTVVACLFTYSRGAWIAMGAGLIVYLVRKSIPLALVVLVLAVWVGSGLLPASVVDRWNMTETSGGQLESSADMRLVAWQEGIRLIEENPILGIGDGRFAEVVQLKKYGNIHLEPHNMYVKVASEQGIPALICFLGFLLLALFAALGPKDPFTREIFLAYLACWVAVVIVNMFGNRMLREGLVCYFWLFTGVIAWLRTQQAQRPNEPA
jgi:O-antigen ligase